MRNSFLKINTRVASSFVHWSLRVLFIRSTILHFYKHRLIAVPFILMLMIRWTAFSVSFRHFSRCYTLLCLSCRPETRDEKLHSDDNCRPNGMKARQMWGCSTGKNALPVPPYKKFTLYARQINS